MTKNDKVVGVDMQNRNALISMACVSQNANNPFMVFCEYIKYCVYKVNTKSFTIKDIRSSVGQEFGVDLPYHIIGNCLSILENEGVLHYDKHVITRGSDYDISSFENKRIEYRQIESDIISKLIDYVAKYGKNWNEEHARDMLIYVLDKQGLAFGIFLHDETITYPTEIIDQSNEESIEKDDDDAQASIPLFSDTNLVGRFIQDILDSDSLSKEYLLKICEGLMICAGSYQLPAEGFEYKKTNIKGTGFIFDTKLLLRFLGCAGDAAVTATKELVKLIQDDGGLIFFYPHTKKEIQKAFKNAINDIFKGYPPKDDEMRLYVSRTKNSIQVLKAKEASFVGELTSANIFEKPLENYSDSDRIKHGFELDVLKKYMYSRLRWEQKTIDNDALSIWETHMRRKGDYSDYCGTAKHLDVFVTSNPQLIYVSLNFKNETPYLESIQQWQANRLPVITDMRLMCRLWSPAAQAKHISQLYLTSNVVAALKPTKKYIEEVRNLAIELKKEIPAYSEISLSSFFDDNISDAILQSTKGLESNLDIGVFASSIAELVEWNDEEQKEKLQYTTSERDAANEKLEKQKEEIITGAVEFYREKLRWRRPVLIFFKNWVLALTIIWALVASFVSFVSKGWIPFLSVLVPVIVKAIEIITSSQELEKCILKKILPVVEHSFAKKITKSLRTVEVNYQEEIISQSLEQTKLINNCRKLIQ